MESSVSKNGLVDYYQKSGWWYAHFWDRGGLHHGIFERTTRSHRQAVENQYKIVIREGLIRKGMKVLDVGCGVGDGACYIAKMTGAKVLGITIVPNQVNEAYRLARQLKVDHLVDFKLMDFQRMDLPKDHFDVIYGIESISHSSDKNQFLKEAKKVLKHEGRVVIIDGYLEREIRSEREKKNYYNLLEGWHLYELGSIKDMLVLLEKNGFLLVKKRDYVNEINRSLKRMSVLVRLGRILPIRQAVRDNTLGMMGWTAGVAAKLFGYYMIVAKKNK